MKLNPDRLGKGSAKLQETIKASLIGQEKAVEEVVRLYQQQAAGLTYPDRPLGTALLMGPTGVGKTELVRLTAKGIHGNVSQMLRIDCGEYQESHSIAKLIGSPPGYKGHGESKLAITQEKLNGIAGDSHVSVVCFDEIEKAHRSVRDLLLGIFDSGTLSTDREIVDFSRSLCFLTSNIGTKDIESLYSSGMGFSPGVPHVKSVAGEAEKRAVAALSKTFSPEFINRLDSVLVFEAFSIDQVRSILEYRLDDLAKAFISSSDLTQFVFRFSPKALDLVLSKGYSVKYNARYLKRAINHLFLQKLACIIESDQIKAGDLIEIDVEESSLSFHKTSTLSEGEMKLFVTNKQYLS